MIYKALLVDDEDHGLRTLAAKIEWSNLPIQIIGQVDSVDRAIKVLQKGAPDFVFLDIKMPQKDGFHLLDHIDKQKTDVIFTTAHEDYALKAFKHHAVGYLLKPIIQRELTPLLSSLIAKRGSSVESLQVVSLKSGSESIQFDLSDIMYVQSEGSKCALESESLGTVSISHHLKMVEESIVSDSFYRIHHQTIVNMAHILKVQKGRYAHLEMKDGTQLEISRSRKMTFYRSYELYIFNN